MGWSKALVGATVAAALSLIHHGAIAQDQLKLAVGARGGGKTVAYSTNGSSTHTSVLALKKFTGADFVPTQTGAAPGTYTQVMSGQIDVGWAGAPFGVDAVEQGKTRVVAKASDDLVLDRQTIRLLIANSNEMAQRPDVFVRFMRAYRESLEWVYATPEGLAAYAKWASISEATAKRALAEFLPKAA